MRVHPKNTTMLPMTAVRGFREIEYFRTGARDTYEQLLMSNLGADAPRYRPCLTTRHTYHADRDALSLTVYYVEGGAEENVHVRTQLGDRLEFGRWQLATEEGRSNALDAMVAHAEVIANTLKLLG